MALLTLQQVTFRYPNDSHALHDIEFSVERGEYVAIAGHSGCGKSTLLKLIKAQLMPTGQLTGKVIYDERPLNELDEGRASSEIGFVMQNPDNQIVTQYVWSELAFGLENIGVSQSEIRRRVAEIANFFGIQSWFHEKTEHLSGGQKQLLNLASILVMQPKLLLLDEPTAQLDPIAASGFLQTLRRIHEEFGMTILIVEHNLEELLQSVDRVLVLEKGQLRYDGAARGLHQHLSSNDPIFEALPTAMQVTAALESKDIPITIQQGQKWLRQFPKRKFTAPKIDRSPETVLEAKQIAFRYDKNSRDIVSGFDIAIKKGDIFTILGGNGSGKSTALSLMTGLQKPQKGKIFLYGKKLHTYRQSELYGSIIASVPQDPKLLFVTQTVQDELAVREEDEETMQQFIEQFELTHLLQQHPYDLSGGEQQKVALAKVLQKNADIIVLDEPTKGLDAAAKRMLGKLLQHLQKQGKTIIIVTHDIPFVAAYSSRCALFFDGAIISEDEPHPFFSRNYFYTTPAQRLSRQQFDGAILVEDVIKLCKMH